MCFGGGCYHNHGLLDGSEIALYVIACYGDSLSERSFVTGSLKILSIHDTAFVHKPALVR